MTTIVHRFIRPLLIQVLAPALILAAACTTDITRPDEEGFELVLGSIQPSAFVGRGEPRTSAVVIGDTLIVRVDSFGRLICDQKGELRLDLDREARRLTVTPLDRFNPELACLDRQVTFEHADTLRLPPGSWTVIFRGRAVFIPHARVITVEHAVEVPGGS